MAKNVSIRVLDDGPLKISGDSITVRFDGSTVATKDGKDLYLCRCGRSKNAPFCDNSHRDNGFVGSSEAKERKPLKVWEGKTIRTVFNPNACMHVFYCKPLNDLRRRELEGDAEAAKEIARVVMSCPSGALRYESTVVETELSEPEADIEIVAGGEVRIRCGFEIDAETLEGQPGDRATLCRCGESKNKPWCDGRHRKREDFR